MATYGTFVDGVALTAAEANDFFTITTPTPVLRQSIQISTTGAYGIYAKVNKTVTYVAHFVCGSDGTANNRIEIDLPVTAASNNERVVGFGYVDDASATDIIRVAVVRVSTTRVALLSNLSTSLTTYLGQTGGPTLTIASGDAVSINIRYEAA